MDQKSFDTIISDEKRSLEYLLSRLNNIRCPLCNYDQYYLMNRKKIRCRECKKDYNPLVSTKFSCVNLPYSKWLVLIKFFELSVSAWSASMQSGISYKTVLKVYDLNRLTIIEEMARNDDVLKTMIKSYEYFGGNRKKMRREVMAFGIRQRKDKVSVDMLNYVPSEILLTPYVQKAGFGNVAYVEKWMNYDLVMLALPQQSKICCQKKFDSHNMSKLEEFWSFTKEKMQKHHHISTRKILYYIKEMEWRYNNKNSDLFDMIICYMLGVNYT